MAKRLKSVTSLKKESVAWGEVKKQATHPETLKPVNRRARRAIKSGRKHSEKQSMEKSAAGSHD